MWTESCCCQTADAPVGGQRIVCTQQGCALQQQCQAFDEAACIGWIHRFGQHRHTGFEGGIEIRINAFRLFQLATQCVQGFWLA